MQHTTFGDVRIIDDKVAQPSHVGSAKVQAHAAVQSDASWERFPVLELGRALRRSLVGTYLCMDAPFYVLNILS